MIQPLTNTRHGSLNMPTYRSVSLATTLALLSLGRADQPHCASMWEHENAQGEEYRITPECNDPGCFNCGKKWCRELTTLEGPWRNRDVEHWNDRISSFKVNEGCWLRLWCDAGGIFGLNDHHYMDIWYGSDTLWNLVRSWNDCVSLFECKCEVETRRLGSDEEGSEATGGRTFGEIRFIGPEGEEDGNGEIIGARVLPSGDAETGDFAVKAAREVQPILTGEYVDSAVTDDGEGQPTGLTAESTGDAKSALCMDVADVASGPLCKLATNVGFCEGDRRHLCEHTCCIMHEEESQNAGVSEDV